MAANNKVDLKLDIKTNYDAAPMQEATEAVRRQTAEEEALETQMRLVTLGKKALQQEVQRLTQLRKEAAAAGDAEAYKKLTAQLAQTRAELKKLQQAKQVDKLVMFGQAQTAAQLTGQMKSLSDQLKSGSTDFAGMTMQVVNMGLAFKALAGPVGLVMAGLQLAQQGLDYVLNKRKEATEKQTKEAQKAAEEAATLAEAFRELGRLGQSVTLAHLQKEIEAANKAIEKAADAEEAKAQRKLQTEQTAAELAQAQADKELEVEQARIATEETLGRMSAEQAAQARDRADAAHKAALDRLAAQADARAVKEQETNAKLAEDYAKELEKSIEHLKPIAALKLPTEDEYRQLEKRLDLLDADTNVAVYEREKRGLENILDKARAMLRAAEIPFEGTEAELVKFLNDIRATVEAQKEAAEAKRDEARADWDAATAARQTADAHEKERQLANDAAEAQRESAAATRRQAQTNKDVADALNNLLDDTKTTGSYAPEEKRTKTEILAADRKILERRRDELAALSAQTTDKNLNRNIAKQQQEVERQLQGLADAVAANTKEARTWLREFTPPELQAKYKGWQRLTDRYSELLAKQVKNAERAAEAGSPEQVERAKKDLTRTADALKRVSGRSSQVDAVLKEVYDRLDGARGAADDTQKAQKRAGKNADELADNMEKVADKVAEQKPADTARDAGQAAAEIRQQMDALKTQMDAFGQAQQGLQTAVGALSTAVQTLATNSKTLSNAATQAAAASTAAAKAAAAATKQMARETARLWAAINDIRAGL